LAEPASAAPHRLELAESWDLWATAALRSAGFPFDGVLAFSTPELAEAIDGPGLAAELEGARAAAAERMAVAVHRVVTDPAFQEALLWQNRTAFLASFGLPPRLGGDARARTKRWRRREELVARYWQRYCTKNDTIGFFGPAGWAQLRLTGPPTAVAPGPRLTASRRASLELWCLDAVCDALTERLGLRPHLAPARAPAATLEGRDVRMPGRPRIALTEAEAVLLAACDGSSPASQLVLAVLARPATGLRSEADGYRLLEGLARRDLISWELRVVPCPQPEQRLCEALSRLPADLAAPAVAALQELDAHRERAEAAEGPEALDRALAGLDEAFVRQTGGGARRRPGETYAGRTVAYLDCRRDVRVELGPEVMRDLARPIAVLLRSARWLTSEVRRAYEEALCGLHRQLVAATGSPRVPMAELWFWSQGLFFGASERPVDTVLREFVCRWEAVLGLDARTSANRRLEHAVADVEAAASSAFAAERRGWPAARYHSLDLLPAADGPDGLRAGRVPVVLGELHVSWNTIAVGVLQAAHPEPGAMARWAELDLPEPRVRLELPRGWPRFGNRTADLVHPPSELRVAFAPAPRPPGVRTLALADLTVEESEGRLVATAGDGSRLDAVDLYGDLLSTVVVDAFKGLTAARHRPRTSIGRLVVLRESWTFEAGDLELSSARGEIDRFTSARRWARAEGLPRFVFVRTPNEPKPWFADLESVAFVNLLGGAVRRAGSGPVHVSEMLPGPGELWLPDAAGRRYCSELRVVAVDRAPSAGGAGASDLQQVTHARQPGPA
jgi:hypothetical protein